jgi:hypothetical protein
VDTQALSVVDELDAAIAALGLHLHTPSDSQHRAAHDVQIWSDGSITCRVGSATESVRNEGLDNGPPMRAREERERLTNRAPS